MCSFGFVGEPWFGRCREWVCFALPRGGWFSLPRGGFVFAWRRAVGFKGEDGSIAAVSPFNPHSGLVVAVSYLLGRRLASPWGVGCRLFFVFVGFLVCWFGRFIALRRLVCWRFVALGESVLLRSPTYVEAVLIRFAILRDIFIPFFSVYYFCCQVSYHYAHFAVVDGCLHLFVYVTEVVRG